MIDLHPSGGEAASADREASEQSGTRDTKPSGSSQAATGLCVFDGKLFVTDYTLDRVTSHNLHQFHESNKRSASSLEPSLLMGRHGTRPAVEEKN